MECVLVWLAVMATTFHRSQAPGSQAPCEVKINGIDTDNFKAGRIEICVGGNMRTVCADGWDEHAAMVACRQLIPGSGYAAMSCNNSCFGRKNGKGVSEFSCTGNEGTLLECGGTDALVEQDPCNHHAGVLCCRDTSTCPLILLPTDQVAYSTCAACNRTCPALWNTDTETGTTPTMHGGRDHTHHGAETTPTMGVETTLSMGAETMGAETLSPKAETMPTPTTTEGDVRADQQSESCPSLAALGGGLGGLSAILAILLVGVVMGWVWSCHRRTGKSGLQERANTRHPHTFQNPSYTRTSLSNTTPSVQYSSLGPRGTPLAHSPSAAPPPSPAIYDVINERVVVKASTQPQGSGEGIYHVLEGPQEGGHLEEGRRGGGGEDGELEEGEYYLVGEVGEEEGLTYEVPISTIPAPAQPATLTPWTKSTSQ